MPGKLTLSDKDPYPVKLLLSVETFVQSFRIRRLLLNKALIDLWLLYKHLTIPEFCCQCSKSKPSSSCQCLGSCQLPCSHLALSNCKIKRPRPLLPPLPSQMAFLFSIQYIQRFVINCFTF